MSGIRDVESHQVEDKRAPDGYKVTPSRLRAKTQKFDLQAAAKKRLTATKQMPPFDGKRKK